MKSKLFSALFAMLTISIFVSYGCVSSQIIHINSQSATSTPKPLDNASVIPTNISGNGNFSLIINEAEINSWVTEQLNSRAEKIIYNPKVFLRDGYIEIDGFLNQPPVTADVTIKLQISQDNQGKFILNLLSANFGNLPVPASIVNSFINSIDINNLINTSGRSLIIQKVKISEGFLTISGIKE